MGGGGEYEMGAYPSSMMTRSHNLQNGNGKAGQNSFIKGGLGALPQKILKFGASNNAFWGIQMASDKDPTHSKF